jgi:hypothetical protein
MEVLERELYSYLSPIFIESPKRALMDSNLDKRAEALNMELGALWIPS